MPLSTAAKNKLLDNVFRGVTWDTPNVLFGNMNVGLSSTVPNPDGSGITPITVTSNSQASSIWNGNNNASGGQATDNGQVALISTAAAARGTIRSIIWYEGSAGTTPRFWFNLPTQRVHYAGDSLTLGYVTLRFV